MSRSTWRPLMALAIVATALFVAACGSGGGGGGGGDEGTEASGTSSGGGNVTEQLFAGSSTENAKDPAAGGKKGGKMTVLASGDVDYLDPGKSYYSFAFGIIGAMHRSLYSTKPGSADPVPDLATGPPEISDDNKTVTIKINKGVMFSKPVNREVTTKDVKYAIERAFTTNVSNGYATAYLGDIVGAPSKQGSYKEIPGIETPDKYTIVFKLKKGLAAPLVGALGLSVSAPVPKEYAQKYDKDTPSTYGEGHAVYTGPYMVRSDATGKAVGYTPGREISLIRNPQYKNVGDYRPAFMDQWDIREGNDDPNSASRRILAGKNMVTGDIEAPASRLESLLKTNKKQLGVVSGGGWRMISFDNSRPPFNDINVRKAVIAGFDRNAARQQRGGEALGPMAQHMIPPGVEGFEESGGVKGFTEFDWLQHPSGDKALSQEYFKKAGFKSGKYEGGKTILLVGDNTDPDKSIAQITEQQLRQMGFKTSLRLVSRDTMFTRFCNAPKSDVNVCPSVGWSKDFNDPQTLMDLTFNGEQIIPSGNSNWPELNVPKINKDIDAGRAVTDKAERAQAWANINKEIVAQAPAITYMWDYQSALTSPNVRGVQNEQSTTWDYSFTSLK